MIAAPAHAASGSGKLDYTLAKKTKALIATIKFEKEFDVKTFKLDNPPRFIIDITPALLPGDGVKGGQTYEIGTKTVKSIRIAQNSKAPDIVRIVIDTTIPAAFEIEQSKKGNKITIKEKSSGAEEPGLTKLPSPSVDKGRASTSITFEVGGKDAGFNAVQSYNDDGSFTLKIAFPGFAAPAPGKTVEISAGIADNITWKQDGKTAYAIVHTTVPTAYKLDFDADSSRLVLTVNQPSLYGKTICIDPGHGGKDPGAIGPDGTHEKYIVLDVGLRLRRLLRSAGARVVMTRSDDTFIPLQGRCDIANNAPCDLFLAVHCNALENQSASDARGSQVYYYNTDAGKEYARTVLDEMTSVIGLGDMGVFSSHLYVVRNTQMPAVLAEIAFITQRKDLALLLTPEFRENVARGLYNGLEAELGMNSARLPALKLPDEVASLIQFKPHLTTAQPLVCRPGEPEPGIPFVEKNSEQIPEPSENAETVAPVPDAEETAAQSTEWKPARVRQPKSLPSYPREPWNIRAGN